MREGFPFKVCIPIPDLQEGGLFTFLAHLTRYFDRHGIEYTRNIFAPGYDILFLNGWRVSWWMVLLQKLIRPRLRVIHRIDGSAQDYGRGAEWDKKQRRVNRYVDLTVFQSAYGRYATREKFPVIGQDGPIVHNPVDIDLFRPGLNREGDRAVRNRVAFVTFSTNKKKGFDSIYRLARENQDLEFRLIGRFSEAPDLPNIRCMGIVPRAEMPKALGDCDFFLFLSENDTCPNSVLEAMACGLPVLYLDSGGTKELAGPTGVAISELTFRAALDRLAADWETHSRAARARAEEFSVDKMIPRYLEAIRGSRRK